MALSPSEKHLPSVRHVGTRVSRAGTRPHACALPMGCPMADDGLSSVATNFRLLDDGTGRKNPGGVPHQVSGGGPGAWLLTPVGPPSAQSAPLPVVSSRVSKLLMPSALAVSVAAYAAGMCVGGILSFPNAVRLAGLAARLRSFQLVDLDAQAAPFELWLFNASPSGGGIVDHATFTLAAADALKVCGVIPFEGYFPGGGNVRISDNDVMGEGKPIVVGVGTTAYAALVVRGAATWTNAANLGLTLNVEQD